VNQRYLCNINATSLAKYVKIKSAPARLILVSVSKITFFYINPALLSGMSMAYSPLTL